MSLTGKLSQTKTVQAVISNYCNMPATCVEINGLMTDDKRAFQPTNGSFRYDMKLY